MRRFLTKLHSATAFVPVCLLLLLVLLPTVACGKRGPRSPRRPPLPPPSASAPAEEAKRPEVDATGGPQMSEPERKAAARAAYSEGVQLQDNNDCAHALPRFESAQRLFEAPTHLLHIAQCQAATGRLVEAQESYATLAHLTLNPQGPPAFREAQEAGRVELAKLKPRIPTLRLDTNPPPASLKGLVVQINGTQMPADLVGVARPINPGRYHVTMTAGPGKSGASDVEIKEGDAKALEVRFTK
ncbi:MAG TPA: hypothetical protein VLT33_24855 [Labilithrix sp.]|nr:hypothetical protein [Labilithrix sp.]